VVKPVPDPMYAQYGMPSGGFDQLESFLSSDFNISNEELTDGHVSAEADILLLLAPEITDDKQLFAIDQFLMQGGTVVVASSPFKMRLLGRSLNLQKHDSGLGDWLAHHGLQIDETLVLDPQNAAFPLPVSRNVGGFQVQEVRMLDYPYFIDIRPDGMNQDNAIAADLPQLSMAWASPINITASDADERETTELLFSSTGSWLSASTDILPRVDASGVSSFKPTGERSRKLLGVISEGRFSSFFKGKESPLLEPAPEGTPEEGADPQPQEPATAGAFSSVIEHSSEAARIIVYSSNDFLQDMVIGMAGTAGGTEYLNSLQVIANTLDWALEDRELLSIRARGHFNRTLPPMERGTQVFWEYLNYGLAALAIALVALARYYRQRQRRGAFSHYIPAQEAA
jgi:ABC-2 type transport system permease protein